MSTLIVIAKEPRPGHSKTRLTPPCTPQQAAGLAAAALRDTLDAVAATPARRRLLVLDGAPGPWVPRGFDVIPQHDSPDLADRLADAFAHTGGPALLVGMDTPQLTPRQLAGGLRALARADAVLGLAPDGGYWAIGLRAPDPRVFAGVPMSAATTGARQQERLRRLGLRTAMLPVLEDVDTFAEACRVAAAAPHTHFAQALRAVEHRVAA